MKKYKHKIIVINYPFKLAGFVDIIVLRKNRKKRLSKNRYKRKCFEINIPIFIPDVEDYMQ